MKRATIYLRDAVIYTLADSLSTEGLWVSTGLTRTASMNDWAKIAEDLRQALVESNAGAPIHVGSLDNVALPLLNEAKVKSFAVFAKSAKCLLAEAAEGKVLLVPTRRSRGYEALRHEAENFSLTEPNLGKEILRILNQYSI